MSKPRYSAIVVSGHRDIDVGLCRSALSPIFHRAVAQGAKRFVFGGARGADEAALETAALIARAHIVMVTPWVGYEPAGGEEAKGRIAERRVANVDQFANAAVKLLTRNTAMLDSAGGKALLIAVWDGRERGGTWDTVKKARARGMEVVVLSPADWKIRKDAPAPQ